MHSTSRGTSGSNTPAGHKNGQWSMVVVVEKKAPELRRIPTWERGRYWNKCALCCKDKHDLVALLPFFYWMDCWIWRKCIHTCFFGRGFRWNLPDLTLWVSQWVTYMNRGFSLHETFPEGTERIIRKERIGSRDEKVSTTPFFDGGFKYSWNFHPYLWKIPNLTNIFGMGWFNHQPASVCNLRDKRPLWYLPSSTGPKCLLST